MKQKIILAFSGGSDSTFLLEIIYRFTSRICHTVFFQTPFVSVRTLKSVCSFLENRGINYTILPVDLLSDPGVVANQPDRCYHCKRHLFEELFKHFDYPSESLRFMEGTNFTEVLNEYRPGLTALEEQGVESPLRLSGMLEEDIETLRKEHGIARGVDDIGCLATRIPYGTMITQEIIKRIDEAEDFLRQRGFHQIRARYMGDTVKIEVNPNELGRLAQPPLRGIYLDYLKNLGFSGVLLDLKGYQRGILSPREGG